VALDRSISPLAARSKALTCANWRPRLARSGFKRSRPCIAAAAGPEPPVTQNYIPPPNDWRRLV